MNARSLPASAVLVSVVLAVAAAAPGCDRDARSVQKPPERDAVEIRVVKATVADIESVLEISGSLAPQSRVGVTAKIPGRLERVAVELGDRVSAGSTIATLERREVEAQVDAAVAAVAVARAGLEAAGAALDNASQEATRARTLFERGALPRQRLDAAETAARASAAQVDLAKANVAQAEAAERRARELLRDTTLVSPVAGVIVERNHDPGALVGRGEPPVAVVADISVLKLEAGVSELDAGRLHVGSPVTVEVTARPAGHFDGRLAAIAPEVDARNRHFRIEVRVSNPRGELLGGMYAVARIVTGTAPRALTVPRDAVSARNGQRVAFKVLGETVRAVPVVEGISDTDRVQIVSGLREGDLVLADTRRTVAEGTRVKAILE
jgi:RND family efflux transporter MFP subunit